MQQRPLFNFYFSLNQHTAPNIHLIRNSYVIQQTGNVCDIMILNENQDINNFISEFNENILSVATQLVSISSGNWFRGVMVSRNNKSHKKQKLSFQKVQTFKTSN